MTDVFRISPLARVAAGDLTALLAALAQTSQPFRIGGAGPLEAGRAEFETLTSGSSGRPRHIKRSMKSWTQSFAINAELFGIGPGVRVAVLGGPEQSLALYGATEALHLGAEIFALAALRPDRQRRALAEAGVQVLYATPAQLRLMIECAGPKPDQLRTILVGGSKLDGALRRALAAMAPQAALREFYGAAEASFITLAGPDDPEGSVGRPYPGVVIEIRGALDEVWVRSPYLFAGYAGPDPGPARWDGDWLSVGEIGRLQGGCLFLSGRAGRMVTVADHNVFPEAIEEFLMTLSGVERAAVLPSADALRGVHLVAFLRGKPEQEPKILTALRQEFGPLKAPKALIWLQDWPVLASGKTDLLALGARVAL
jgi:long-chain acyl-CoA synthetase